MMFALGYHWYQDWDGMCLRYKVEALAWYDCNISGERLPIFQQVLDYSS